MEVGGHVSYDLVPDGLRHILAHLDLLSLFGWHFAPLGKLSLLLRTGPLARGPQGFLLDN